MASANAMGSSSSEVLGVALAGDRWPDQRETAGKLWTLVAGVAGVPR